MCSKEITRVRRRERKDHGSKRWIRYDSVDGRASVAQTKFKELLQRSDPIPQGPKNLRRRAPTAESPYQDRWHAAGEL